MGILSDTCIFRKRRSSGYIKTIQSNGYLSGERLEGLTPEAQNAINRLKSINTDWNDILFRDAITQEYNISISGGSEKVTYYNSLGYTLENGNIPGVSLSRFNLTSKTSYQINKLLKVGVSIFANRRKNTTFLTDTYGLTNPVYYSRIANPYFEPFDNNNNYLYDYDVVTGSIPDLLQGYNILEEREIPVINQLLPLLIVFSI